MALNMILKYLVLVIFIAFVFIDGGITQDNTTSTKKDENTTDVLYDTDVSGEVYEDGNTNGTNAADASTITDPPTTPDKSSATPNRITLTTAPAVPEEEEQEEEENKNCFSLMRPTVFTLLVMALCFICLLFIYTIICSCVLAKRRIGDVESPNTAHHRKVKSKEKEKIAKPIKENTKLKEAEKKKKKTEKKKQAQASKEAAKKEKTEKKKTPKEKKGATEKESSSKEQSIVLKETGTCQTKATTADTGKKQLEAVEENIQTNKDKTDANQMSDKVDTSEIRISNIPPPPLDEPSVIQTDVIIESLPPPPPPEDIEGKNLAEAETDNATEVNAKPDVTPSSATATYTKPENVADTDRNEEAALNESQDPSVDLTNVGMKLDEVLEMLHSINE